MKTLEELDREIAEVRARLCDLILERNEIAAGLGRRGALRLLGGVQNRPETPEDDE
mgnify:CR=1 FL=1